MLILIGLVMLTSAANNTSIICWDRVEKTFHMRANCTAGNVLIGFAFSGGGFLSIAENFAILRALTIHLKISIQDLLQGKLISSVSGGSWFTQTLLFDGKMQQYWESADPVKTIRDWFQDISVSTKEFVKSSPALEDGQNFDFVKTVKKVIRSIYPDAVYVAELLERKPREDFHNKFHRHVFSKTQRMRNLLKTNVHWITSSVLPISAWTNNEKKKGYKIVGHDSEIFEFPVYIHFNISEKFGIMHKSVSIMMAKETLKIKDIQRRTTFGIHTRSNVVLKSFSKDDIESGILNAFGDDVWKFAAPSTNALQFAASPSIFKNWFKNNLVQTFLKFLPKLFSFSSWPFQPKNGGPTLTLGDGGHYLNFGIVPLIQTAQKEGKRTGVIVSTVQIGKGNVASMLGELFGDGQCEERKMQFGKPCAHIFENKFGEIKELVEDAINVDDVKIKRTTRVVFKATTVTNEKFGIGGGCKYTFIMIFGNSNQIEKPQLISNWVNTYRYGDVNSRILANMKNMLRVKRHFKTHSQKRRLI